MIWADLVLLPFFLSERLFMTSNMKFYFFCHPHAPADKSGYEHGIVAIAEGLSELGIEIYSNLDYWEKGPGSNEFLIKHQKNIHYSDCDVVIFSTETYNRRDLLPSDLFKTDRGYKLIFIDSSDLIASSKGFITPGFNPEIRKVDFVLKSHFCKKYKYPSNFIPWQFGLTNRMISSLRPLPFSDRKDEVLVNFRCKHQLRDLAEKKVMNTVYRNLSKNSATDSYDKRDFDRLEHHYWTLTGRRHYYSYYQRLGSSKACAAFGGFLQTSKSNSTSILFKILRRIDARFNIFNYDRILQFDSWRFWESLASGCLTIHADFDKYGVVLPVMPINGVHYLGVDFSNLEKSKRDLGQVEKYESIASNGREWALNNYSPVKVAERLLGILL